MALRRDTFDEIRVPIRDECNQLRESTVHAPIVIARRRPNDPAACGHRFGPPTASTRYLSSGFRALLASLAALKIPKAAGSSGWWTRKSAQWALCFRLTNLVVKSTVTDRSGYYMCAGHRSSQTDLVADASEPTQDAE